jgi:hypothetical protein
MKVGAVVVVLSWQGRRTRLPSAVRAGVAPESKKPSWHRQLPGTGAIPNARRMARQAGTRCWLAGRITPGRKQIP